MEQMAKEAQKVASAYKKKAKTIELSEELDDWNVNAIQINNSPLRNVKLPQSHVKDYDEAIEMLEFHTVTEDEAKDTVQLTQQDFRTFVRDDWAWKQNWSASNELIISGSTNIGLGTTNPLNKLHIYAGD